MKRVVLISGGQGSGKSTLAEALQQRLGHLGHMVRVFKFADPIYEMRSLEVHEGRGGGLEDVIREETSRHSKRDVSTQ